MVASAHPAQDIYPLIGFHTVVCLDVQRFLCMYHLEHIFLVERAFFQFFHSKNIFYWNSVNCIFALLSVVGELSARQAEPSFLEVLLSNTGSSLSSLIHLTAVCDLSLEMKCLIFHCDIMSTQEVLNIAIVQILDHLGSKRLIL